MENRETTRPDTGANGAPGWEQQPPAADADAGPGEDWDLGGSAGFGGSAGAGGSAGSGTPPPRPGAGFDPTPVFALLEALRRGVPAELQQQFNALVREVLLALRALIDWYLERVDRGPAEPRVEDIPID